MVTGGSIGRRAIAVGILLAAIAWGAYAWWPSEERRVRKRLAALADTVNDSPRDGLQLVARAARLTSFFEPDVVVDPGGGAAPINGRESLVALASRAPDARGSFRLSFVDVSVEVTGTRASSHLTATIEWQAAGEPPSVDAREVMLDWRKTDAWRIARVTAVEPLEKPH